MGGTSSRTTGAGSGGTGGGTGAGAGAGVSWTRIGALGRTRRTAWFGANPIPANTRYRGGGPGLTNGYGTPRYRVFAGIGFDPNQAVRRVRPKAPILVQETPAPAPAPVPPPVPPEPAPVVLDEVPPMPEPAAVLALVETPELQKTVRDGHFALLAQVQF